MTDYVDRFRHRVLQDALAEATPHYWFWRAEQFRSCLPREEDFLGESTRRSRRERRKRIEAMIEECEKRGQTREALGQEWWREVFDNLMKETG